MTERLGILVAVLASVLALAVALVAVVVSGASGDDGQATAGGSETMAVELAEFSVTPASIEVAAGTELTLEVTNAGQMPHDLKLDGTIGADMLDPGETATVDLGVIDGSGQAWCTVPGHKEAGMVLDIAVSGTPSDSAAGTGVDDGADVGSAAEIDFEAEPGAGWQPYDPTLVTHKFANVGKGALGLFQAGDVDPVTADGH